MMAMPRTLPGVDEARTSIRALISLPLARMLSQLIGTRGSRGPRGVCARVSRSAQSYASVWRLARDTSRWARAASSRLDSGERPSASLRSREGPSSWDSIRDHRRLVRAFSR